MTFTGVSSDVWNGLIHQEVKKYQNLDGVDFHKENIMCHDQVTIRISRSGYWTKASAYS